MQQATGEEFACAPAVPEQPQTALPAHSKRKESPPPPTPRKYRSSRDPMKDLLESPGRGARDALLSAMRGCITGLPTLPDEPGREWCFSSAPNRPLVIFPPGHLPYRSYSTVPQPQTVPQRYRKTFYSWRPYFRQPPRSNRDSPAGLTRHTVQWPRCC